MIAGTEANIAIVSHSTVSMTLFKTVQICCVCTFDNFRLLTTQLPWVKPDPKICQLELAEPRLQ